MDITEFILDPIKSEEQHKKMYDLVEEEFEEVKSFKVYKNYTKVRLMFPMDYEEVFNLAKSINERFDANFALRITQ